MYENILYKPLKFKLHVSLHAKKLLEGVNNLEFGIYKAINLDSISTQNRRIYLMI